MGRIDREGRVFDVDSTITHSSEVDDRRKNESSLPDEIGGYRILRILGKGGMGIVYEAEQQNPKRSVALKVVRGGHFVDDARLRMFEREATTLARLRHPNIGAIYEAGRTSDGLHFFTMELVAGSSLDEYLARRGQVKTNEEVGFRLRLFRKICDAVHYAHQRGVIHRDLKPSNIIVIEEADAPEGRPDGSTVPEIKVLDFGLARITDADIHGATLATEVGKIMGTLAYMSPEQARGDTNAIDIRSDAYTLGVILYEMLTSRRPYDISRTSLVKAVRLICEHNPPPMNQVARGLRRFDSDLETIVGKTLEKEPERRFQSAGALSDDIDRCLNSQPIQSRPPSSLYQLRKFTQRRRGLVVSVAAVLMVMVVGAAVSTLFGLNEAAQRRRAEKARADLERVVEFQQDMLEEIDPESLGLRFSEELRRQINDGDPGGEYPQHEVDSNVAAFDAAMTGVSTTDAALVVIDRELLAPAGSTIDQRFRNEPMLDARLRGSIGRAYAELGLYDSAESYLEEAVSTQQAASGKHDPATLSLMGDLGVLRIYQGRLEDAETIISEVLENSRRDLGEDHPVTIAAKSESISLLHQFGRFDEAETLSREVLEASRRVLGPEHRDTLKAINDLGWVLKYRGKLDEAEPYYREALEGCRRVLGEDHPWALMSLNNLIRLLEASGRATEAKPMAVDLLEVSRRVNGNLHPQTLLYVNNMGVLLHGMGEYEEAELYLREALAGRRRVLGDDHPLTLSSFNNMGWVLQPMGHLQEAEEFYRQALEGRRRVFGPEHPATLRSNNNLGMLLQAYGEFEEATDLLLETLENRRRTLGEEHPETYIALNNVGFVLKKQGKAAEAEPYFRLALEGRRRTIGESHQYTIATMVNLADSLAAQGNFVEAEKLFLEAIECAEQSLPEQHPYRLSAMGAYGRCLVDQNRMEEAEGHLLAAQKGLAEKRGPSHSDTRTVQEELVKLYDGWDKPDEAARWRMVLAGQQS